MSRKFYRYIIHWEILTDKEIPLEMSLADIYHETMEGDYSGDWEYARVEEVDGPAMAKLLSAQGSGPSFFDLDEDSPAIECPECHALDADDGTVADHGRCLDCHKKWQDGMLPSEDEDDAEPEDNERICILTGEEGENPDDCTTHDHEEA